MIHDTSRQHEYVVSVKWTGNLGHGTTSYRANSRDHNISVADRPPVPGSADPAFRGDPARYNPEDMLVGSLSACHMLWYLHLRTDAGGRFERAVLRSRIRIAATSDR
jgi:organic hydroperoxide reductase OsmC/OhrA